jgi:hypothetical protein
MTFSAGCHTAYDTNERTWNGRFASEEAEGDAANDVNDVAEAPNRRGPKRHLGWKVRVCNVR